MEPTQFDADRIRLFAETVGISNITSQGLGEVADQLNDVLRTILRDAVRETMHCRRTTLSVDDMRRVCKRKGINPPLGHLPLGPPKSYRHIANPSGEDLYVLEDRDYDVAELLQRPQPPVPRTMKLRAHWLAVDGKMKSCAENLIFPKKEEEPEEESDDDDEPEVFQSAVGKVKQRRRSSAFPEHNAALAFRFAARNTLKEEHVTVRPLPPASVCLEKQILALRIMEACIGTDDINRNAGLRLLEIDTGLTEILLPIMDYIKTGIKCNIILHGLPMLIYLVRMIRAIVANKAINLDPVMHYIIPSLLSCMVSKQVCPKPATDPHWALRDHSAKTLSLLVKERINTPHNVQRRIVRYLKALFLSEESTMPSIYGSIPPLIEYMNQIDKDDLRPRFNQLKDYCNAVLVQPTDSVQKTEAKKLMSAFEKLEPEMREMSADPFQQYWY